MNENTTKALQTSDLLDQDLREIYKGAIGKNDALVIVAERLLARLKEFRTTPARLEQI